MSRLIQIAIDPSEAGLNGTLYGLCEDGTLWKKSCSGWHSMSTPESMQRDEAAALVRRREETMNE